MAENDLPKDDISRRALLKSIPVAAGVAATLGTMGARDKALAQAKITHVLAKYQDTPNNGRECSTCMQFVSPAACKIVESPINPHGWCQFYGKKA